MQIAVAQLIEAGEEGDALPERIVLFPSDPLEAAIDGRQHVVTDAAAVVAETLRRAPSDGRRPVTFDHAGLYGSGWSAPAAGWLSDFRVEGDGSISAAVAWTPRGTQALSDREYRYVSAEYKIRRRATAKTPGRCCGWSARRWSTARALIYLLSLRRVPGWRQP